MNVTFTQDRDWAIESPVHVVEGSTITFACTYWGAVTSPSAVAYRNNTPVTTVVFPTNTPSSSGSVTTLSPATGFVGDAKYVVAVTGTVGGDVPVKKIEVVVGKDEGEQ